jgi:hypothetical protein
MAVDHYKYNFLNDFELRVAAANPDPKIGYSNGRTGYEQYYIDMYSFWRELYNPNLNEDLIKAESSCGNLEIDITNKTDTLFGIPNQNTGEPEGGLKEYLANIINSETNEEARRFIEQMYTKFPDYIYKDDKGINIYEPNMVASYLRDTCN